MKSLQAISKAKALIDLDDSSKVSGESEDELRKQRVILLAPEGGAMGFRPF